MSIVEGGYGAAGPLLTQGYVTAPAPPVVVPRSSLLYGGYGLRPRLLAQGYGIAAVPVHGRLRETFGVPLPDGAVATRHAPDSRPPYIGSLEADISFALDFGGWLDTAAGETLLSSTTSAFAFPTPAASLPYDATALLVHAQQTTDTAAIATLHQATPQTFYVLTVSATTSTGRVLECRMPRIWCPD